MIRIRTVVAALVSLVWSGEVYAADICASVATPTYNQASDFGLATPVDLDVANSGVAGWGGTGGGTITLRKSGLNYFIGTKSIGLKVWTATAADFDKDGWTDLVAVVIDAAGCHLQFLKNAGSTAGVFQGFTAGGSAQLIATPSNCDWMAFHQLVSGDFDKDGNLDFLYLDLTPGDDDRAGTLRTATLYRGTGLVSGVPKFTAVNVLSDLSSPAKPHWHWASMDAVGMDWKNGADGRTDLVMLDSYGTTNRLMLYKAKTSGSGFQAGQVLISDLGYVSSPSLVCDATHTAPAPGSSTVCTSNPTRGPGLLMVGDFDADGDTDVITGTVSRTGLHYWKNDGADHFTRQTDIPFPQSGASAGVVADFDGDGDLDFMVGVDGWNCRPTDGGGEVWLFTNDGHGTFTESSTKIMDVGTGSPPDLDFGLVFDMDHDAENRPDLLFSDGNGSGQYTYGISQTANIYNLTGRAQSLDISSKIIPPGVDGAISSVSLVAYTASTPANTSINFYVANTGCSTGTPLWEKLTAAQLASGGAVHDFQSYGSELCWRAELATTVNTVTPSISALSFNTTYYPRYEYSRSSLAFGQVKDATGTLQDRVFAASFWFPGFEGTVKALDPSKFTTAGAKDTCISGCSTYNKTAATVWDAGTVLVDTRPSGRHVQAIYASDADGDNEANDLMDFTQAQVEGTATSPTLQDLLVVDDGSRAAVVNFALGQRTNGALRSSVSLMFDTGHSSPVFVTSPSGNAAYAQYLDPDKKRNWDSFKSDNSSRAPMVYIGANDGMLHAFSAFDGKESWALIPQNLLPRIKQQMGTDANGYQLYLHQSLVDGRLVVRDVYDTSAKKWRTIAFSGEGHGKGVADNNFYFAVDVTDPELPQPLWEYTDPIDATLSACSDPYDADPLNTHVIGDSATIVTHHSHTDNTYACGGSSSNAVGCAAACAAGYYMFQATTSSPKTITMEAEHYTVNTPLNSHTWKPVTLGGESCLQSDPPGGGASCNTSCPSSNCYTTCSPVLRYEFRLTSTTNFYVYIRARAPSSSANNLMWGVDGTVKETLSTTTYGSWIILNGAKTGNLGAGDHYLNIWMAKDGMAIEKIILSTNNTAPAGTSELCADRVVSSTVVPEPDTFMAYGPGAKWPAAFCPDSTDASPHSCCGTYPGKILCLPSGGSCNTSVLDQVLGETWSPPEVGRVTIGGKERWIVAFASGYNNRGNLPQPVGRAVYALDAVTGSLLARWNLDDPLDAYTSGNSEVENTVPAGGVFVDLEPQPTGSASPAAGYGFVDLFYIGDLEGRLWRIELTEDGTVTAGGLVSNWPITKIFDAGSPDGSTRVWAPIVTKPAIGFLNTPTDPSNHSKAWARPHIYFGTGGYDRAPAGANDYYRFYAIFDDGTDTTRYADSVPQANGTSTTHANANLEFYVKGEAGFKFWSDPLVTNNAVVYFASLQGDIEATTPCASAASAGAVASYVYAYAIQRGANSSGVPVTAGMPIAGSQAQLSSKVMQTFTLRGANSEGDITAPPTPVHPATSDDRRKKVSYGDFAGQVHDVGGSPEDYVPSGLTTHLKVIKWREVPL